MGVVGNVIIVLLGFGSVVLVHEFGHFIIAKLGGIKVEAFSIFMPPTLLGIRKTKAGFKFRFLPSLYAQKEQEPAGEDGDGVRSALCAPLLGREGAVLGLIYLDHAGSEHSFGEEDLDFFTAFAGMAAVRL